MTKLRPVFVDGKRRGGGFGEDVGLQLTCHSNQFVVKQWQLVCGGDETDDE